MHSYLGACFIPEMQIKIWEILARHRNSYHTHVLLHWMSNVVCKLVVLVVTIVMGVKKCHCNVRVMSISSVGSWHFQEPLDTYFKIELQTLKVLQEKESCL